MIDAAQVVRKRREEPVARLTIRFPQSLYLDLVRVAALDGCDVSEWIVKQLNPFEDLAIIVPRSRDKREHRMTVRMPLPLRGRLVKHALADDRKFADWMVVTLKKLVRERLAEIRAKP